MSVKDIHRRLWECDWNCGGRRASIYTNGKEHITVPRQWSRIWGGGDPGSGDPYPIHLCPDCTELYNYCKSGKSEQGKRFREFYNAFKGAEKEFIEPAPEPKPELSELTVVSV
jgi:hypothetical protein